MGLFSKKKLYKIKWSYGLGVVHTDIVAAKNPAQAWEKLKERHLLASLVEMEEIPYE